jgi:hypothetical protein
MVNCQLPESVSGVWEPLLELPPPHAESITVLASDKNSKGFIPALAKRRENDSRLGSQLARLFVNPSMFRVLET